MEDLTNNTVDSDSTNLAPDSDVLPTQEEIHLVSEELLSSKEVQTEQVAPLISEELPSKEEVQIEQVAPLISEEKPIKEPSLDDKVKKELQEMDSDYSEEEEEISSEELTVNYMTYSREQLIDALKKLVKEEVAVTKNKISLIKVAFYSKVNQLKKEALDKFIEEGGNKIDFHETADELEIEFKKLLDTYREKRKKYLEEVEAHQQNNLKKRLEVLDELKNLINSEEALKKTYDEFHTLQERWKEIGLVPRSEANTLWQNYHFLVEKFFDKVKINKELKMLDLKKNLESKIELCEKVEELIVENSITKSFKTLQELRDKWREIGPIPSDKNEEVWERFRSAVDKIEQHRHEYYEKLREEQEQNLLAKNALLEKAEEFLTKDFKTIKDWNAATLEMNDLLKLWKTIGNVPKAQNNIVWDRFKMSLDAFFNTKNDWFQKLKDEQQHNYNIKVELCMQAEAIAQREDWRRATDDLLRLQKEWKETGSVPRKAADKIWIRFRAACDVFFEKKAEYFNNMKGIEAENLIKKEELVAKVKALEFSEDKTENLNTIKEIQRQWMEVGFVPIKEKERIQTEFRTAINDLFDKLKISQKEAKEHMFRSKISNLKPEDIERFTSKERKELIDKIYKIKEDIHLWDNNLGFLASSKQADILKKEFEKKIQSAHQEIALLEAQIKILDEAKKK